MTRTDDTGSRTIRAGCASTARVRRHRRRPGHRPAGHPRARLGRRTCLLRRQGRGPRRRHRRGGRRHRVVGRRDRSGPTSSACSPTPSPSSAASTASSTSSAWRATPGSSTSTTRTGTGTSTSCCATPSSPCSSGRAPHGRDRRRVDGVRRVGVGHHRCAAARGVRRGQGRAHGAGEVGGGRAGAVGHPRQRGGARGGVDAAGVGATSATKGRTRNSENAPLRRVALPGGHRRRAAVPRVRPRGLRHRPDARRRRRCGGQVPVPDAAVTGAGDRDVKRPEQPEPFLRGCRFAAGAGVPYPRADAARLHPAAGRHVGDGADPGRPCASSSWATPRRWRSSYRTETDDFGYRGEGAGTTFALWRDGRARRRGAARCSARARCDWRRRRPRRASARSSTCPRA